MKPSTIATLKKLENAEWFSNVGRHDTEVAIVLGSWAEAIDYCRSIDWENLRLEAFNQYRMRLLERSKERFVQWNEIVKELQVATVPLVERKTEIVVAQNELPQVFAQVVQGDIVGVCLESEYADVYVPGFYTGQAYWYVKGHFPCGWRGEFPNGKLIVY